MIIALHCEYAKNCWSVHFKNELYGKGIIKSEAYKFIIDLIFKMHKIDIGINISLLLTLTSGFNKWRTEIPRSYMTCPLKTQLVNKTV